jgi:prophage antirepressor-like protein
MKGTKRNSKQKIVKLYCNPNREAEDDNSSDTESEQDELIEEHPEKIIEKLTNKKIETTKPKPQEIFNINDTDVLVIIDGNNYWYKGKDVAALLEYENTKKAITRNVSIEYKKSYADIGGSPKDPPIKIDPQTIFIDDSGLFQLVSHSKKPEALKLWRTITKEILPTLFRTGSYSLQPTQIQLDELNKNFYDDNMLSDYAKKNAIYLAYIGKYKGKHILKYGKTKDFATRDLEQHRKTFKKFNVIKVWETLACDHAEDNIKINFEGCGMSVTMTKEELGIEIKGKTKRELIKIDEVKNLQYCINIIDNVINKTILPKEQKYIDQIKDLEHTVTLLNNRLTHKDELLESYKDTINILKRKNKI